MTVHHTGTFRGSRQGAASVMQSFIFASAGVAVGNLITSGTNQKLCTIPGSTALPVLLKVDIIEIAANTAAGAVTASVGTASAGTQIHNAVSLKQAAGTNVASSWIYAEADTEIWLNYNVASGTDAAGKFIVLVHAHEVNVVAPNNQEA